MSVRVFFFVPNLIGYIRIILAIISLYYIDSSPFLFLLFYTLSYLLDVADGYAARLLDQSSRFGAVLDMVTDRSTTALILCQLYKSTNRAISSSGMKTSTMSIIWSNGWRMMFPLLIALDISSHYMHMYASLVSGATSHKNVSKNANPLLRLYYTSKLVLFLACAGCEAFYLGLYMIKNIPHTTFSSYFGWNTLWKSKSDNNVLFWLRSITYVIMGPFWAFKQLMNVIQLCNAAIILTDFNANSHIVANNMDPKLKRN